ncbi:MAG: nicotinate-nucleotide adenylyltransferase [Flavobacteriia bacterium]|nr:nicotinate-nucleotide adenylyltransferase [Flavobacteriia bacterium]
MRIGLFFGSFNPIHCGHLMLAEGVLNETDIEQIWFVVTPQNPQKKKSALLNDYDRLNMVREAIHENLRFRASEIEFGLEQPNYTAKTLVYLKEKYPHHAFSLLVGEDNLRNLNSWYNVEYIFANYRIIVYPRSVQENEALIDVVLPQHAKIQLLKQVVVLPLSSSMIRSLIKDKRSVKYLVPESIERMIHERGFYRD